MQANNKIQLAIWLPESLAIDFRVHCIRNKTNMSAEAEKLIRQLLESGKIV
jgi:hypothetical protein